MVELRHGAWQKVLAGITADALISDPPYSSRTHRGHDAVAEGRPDGFEGQRLHYQSWTPDDVDEFVGAWAPRVRGWFVVMTDHVLAAPYEAALRRAGRYVFAPLPFVAPGSRVRLQGDGPSSWTTWVIVARPRSVRFSAWGTLPGAYVLPPRQGEAKGSSPVQGRKPLWLLRALVRDYSARGDLIVDPCAGGGTTLVAAEMEGRRAVGIEQDDAVYRFAKKRIEKPVNLSFGFD